ncbi:MAG: carbohydrate ABC transporter permease [Thermomicrobiales bacterium]
MARTLPGTTSVRGIGAAHAHRRVRRATVRRLLLAYALVAPVVLLRLATTIYPFGYTAYLSLFDNNPIRRTYDFVWLDNYSAMARDPNVRDTLAFTIFFTVVSVSLQVGLGLAIAELLNRQFRLRGFARAVNLLPWATSAIVIGTAAAWVFNQDYGLINDLLWRLTGARPLWLIDVTLARFAVVLTDVWKNTPFLTVVFLGGLQGISAELHEAARIDGAGRFRAFWSITLPMLMPLIVSMAIFTSIYRVLSFEIVYALTEGGPGTATSLMSYQVYLQAFRTLNFGYASALAMGLFAMVLVVGLIGFGILRRTWARLS